MLNALQEKLTVTLGIRRAAVEGESTGLRMSFIDAAAELVAVIDFGPDQSDEAIADQVRELAGRMSDRRRECLLTFANDFDRLNKPADRPSHRVELHR